MAGHLAGAGGGASSSIRRRSATRCSSAGGRSPTRGDCERRTLDVSGDGTNNDGIAPELARRDAALAGVTVNGLVIGANVATLGRYYQQFVIQGPGAFVESAEDYDGFERAMRRKLLRELGVIEMSDGPVNRTGRSRAINARFAARWRGARAGRRSMPGEAQRVRRGGERAGVGRTASTERGVRRAAGGALALALALATPRRRGRRRPTWRRSPAGWRPSSARRRRRSCRGSPSSRRTSCIGCATARRRPRRRRRSTLVALYDDATRTIYLAEGWTGATPRERSVLVHEMAHHVQNLAGPDATAAAAEREAEAYALQDRWLARSGETLETAFEIDALTLLVLTRCPR